MREDKKYWFLSCKHIQCVHFPLSLLLFVNLQKALAKRFQETSASYTINFVFLEMDAPYPITRALRVETRFGTTVLLCIRDSGSSIKVFLPRRYIVVVTDQGTSVINSETNRVILIYRGVCPQTNGFLLAIAEEEERSAVQ
jgi:hypothetical protein